MNEEHEQENTQIMSFIHIYEGGQSASLPNSQRKIHPYC